MGVVWRDDAQIKVIWGEEEKGRGQYWFYDSSYAKYCTLEDSQTSGFIDLYDQEPSDNTVLIFHGLEQSDEDISATWNFGSIPSVGKTTR